MQYCGHKKHRNKLAQKLRSGILKKHTVQKSYDKWSEEVQNNSKEVVKISGKFQERMSCN